MGSSSIAWAISIRSWFCFWEMSHSATRCGFRIFQASERTMTIAPIDWAILAVGFCFFLAWAIYLNSKCRTVADYLVSGRKVRMWLGLGAGIGGEIGLLTIASICEQGFSHGYSFVIINLLSMIITVPLFGVFGFGIERFRATRAMSVPQYIEMRYNKN